MNKETQLNTDEVEYQQHTFSNVKTWVHLGKTYNLQMAQAPTEIRHAIGQIAQKVRMPQYAVALGFGISLPPLSSKKGKKDKKIEAKQETEVEAFGAADQANPDMNSDQEMFGNIAVNQPSGGSSVLNDANFDPDEFQQKQQQIGKKRGPQRNLQKPRSSSKRPEKVQKTDIVQMQDLPFAHAHIQSYTALEMSKAQAGIYVHKMKLGADSSMEQAEQYKQLNIDLLAEIKTVTEFYDEQFPENYQHLEPKKYMPICIYQNIRVKCSSKVLKFLKGLRLSRSYIASSFGLWEYIKTNPFESSPHWISDETLMMHPSYYKIKILRELITYDWSADYWSQTNQEAPTFLQGHHQAIMLITDQNAPVPLEGKPKYRNPNFCCGFISAADLNNTSLESRHKELIAYLYNKDRGTIIEKYQVYMLGMIHPKLLPQLGIDKGMIHNITEMVLNLSAKELFISMMLHKQEIKAFMEDHPGDSLSIVQLILEALGKQNPNQLENCNDGGVSYFIGELMIAEPAAFDLIGTGHFNLLMEHLPSPFSDRKDPVLECQVLLRILSNHYNQVETTINTVYEGRIGIEYRKVLISTWPIFMKPNIIIEMEHSSAPSESLTNLLAMIVQPPDSNFKLQTLETWLLKYRHFLTPLLVAWTENGIRVEYQILKELVEQYDILSRIPGQDQSLIIQELVMVHKPLAVIEKMKALGESNIQHTTPYQLKDLKEKLTQYLKDHGTFKELDSLLTQIKFEESRKKMTSIGRIMRKWQDLICKTILLLMEKFFLCEVIVVPPGYGKTIVILYLAMLIVENYNMRVAIVVTSELQINQARYFYECGYQQYVEGDDWPTSQPIKYFMPYQLEELKEWIKEKGLEEKVVVIVDEIDQVACDGNLEDDQKWAEENSIMIVKAKFNFKQQALKDFQNIIMLTGTADERLSTCLNQLQYKYEMLVCPSFQSDAVVSTIYYNNTKTYADEETQRARILEIFKERWHMQPIVMIIPERPESDRLQYLHDAGYEAEYVLDNTANAFVSNQTCFMRMKKIGNKHVLVIVAEAARGLDCEYSCPSYVINTVRPQSVAEEHQFATRSSRDSRHQSHCEHVLIGNPTCTIQKKIDKDCAQGTLRSEALKVVETAIQKDLIWKLKVANKLHGKTMDVNMVFRRQFYKLMDNPDFVYYTDRCHPKNVVVQVQKYRIFQQYLQIKTEVLPPQFVSKQQLSQLIIKKTNLRTALADSINNTNVSTGTSVVRNNQ